MGRLAEVRQKRVTVRTCQGETRWPQARHPGSLSIINAPIRLEPGLHAVSGAASGGEKWRRRERKQFAQSCKVSRWVATLAKALSSTPCSLVSPRVGRRAVFMGLLSPLGLRGFLLSSEFLC